jgi:phosphoribosylanthranilate isomerase
MNDARRTWVKICGLTTPEAVATALDCGADALGFVFHAPSPRNLAPAQAAALARDVPARVLRVAVTLHPTQALVDEIAAVFRPDALQTDVEDLAALRLPPGLATLPVVRCGATLPSALPPRLLYEGPRSGAGTVADWDAAHALARRTELILAGGLDASNVAAAIAAVQPFGVDVSSGVESAPGRKDPGRIRAFFAAARSASGEC